MKENRLEGMNIPNHIAFIMDGNGRWAKKQGKARNAGHRAGSEALKKICRDANNMGVKYVTVYAFSTENWSRPKTEVDFLMKLLSQYMRDSIKESKKNNMRVRIIGKRTGIPDGIKADIERLEEASKDYTGLQLQIAFNYGSRDEIVRAVKVMAEAVKDGELVSESIDEAVISEYLDTCDIPDPDLLVRTSGEIRLSNYLLWQLAYTEFYFTDIYWPDFNKSALEDAIIAYNKKDRRYGGISDEA